MYFHSRLELDITAATWARYSAVVDLLRPFKEATVQLSSQSQPTVSAVCTVVKALHQFCHVNNGDSAIISSLRSSLKVNLQERFELTATGYPKDLNSPTVVAALFDPRYSKLSIE